MENRLLLVGGGGHCHSVIDSILSAQYYTSIGVVVKDQENLDELMTDPLISPYIVGMDESLPCLFSDGWKNAFITLGSVGSTIGRRALYVKLLRIGFKIPNIIDHSAVLAGKLVVGQGVFIGKRAVVNTGCVIGDCAIINTGAILEHDCHIGNFTHISPGTILCGQVSVDDNSHVGAGSVVRQGLSIGKESMIGIGSVVVKDIPDKVKAYGNPCRVVK